MKNSQQQTIRFQQKLIPIIFASKDIEINCNCRTIKPVNSGQSKYQSYKYDTFYLKGIDLQNKGNYQQSILQFQKSLEVCPIKSDAYIRLADNYYSMNSFNQSIRYYGMAIEIIQKQLQIFKEMDFLYSSQQKHQKFMKKMVEKCNQMSLRLKNNLCYVYYKMGNSYLQQLIKYQQNNILQQQCIIGQAIRCYQKAIENDFNIEQAYINLAIAYQIQNKPTQVYQCYEKALSKLQMADFYFFNNFGNIFYRLKNNEKAIQCFQRSLQFNPESYEALNNLGRSYFKKNLVDQALSCYNNALIINPNSDVTYNNIANLYSRTKKIQAVEYYKNALRINSKNVSILYNFGNHYFSNGQWKLALEQYQKASQVSDNPNQYHIPLLNNLALCYEKLGQLEEGITWLQTAIKIKPFLAECYNNLGIFLYKKDNFNESTFEYEQCFFIDPENDACLSNLALSYTKIDLMQQAGVLFDILRQKYQTPQILNNYGIYLLKRGDNKVGTCLQQLRILTQNNICSQLQIRYQNFQYDESFNLSKLKNFLKKKKDIKIQIKNFNCQLLESMIQSPTVSVEQKNSKNGFSQMVSLSSLTLSDISPNQLISKDSQRSMFLDKTNSLASYFSQTSNFLRNSSKEQDSQINQICSKNYQKIIELKDVKFLQGIWDYEHSPNTLQRYRCLVLKNHLCLIKYLAKNDQKTSFIAKYYFDQQDVYMRHEGNQFLLYKFSFKMQKGLNQFLITSNYQSNQNYIQILWKSGIKEVLLWIKCFFKGIIELQQLGIFHPDLCLRNTIKVKDLQGGYKYKIIDFDYAFKVAVLQETTIYQQQQSYKNTKLFFEHWLQEAENIRKKCHLLRYLFPQLNKYQIYPEIGLIDKKLKQVINETEKNQQNQKKQKKIIILVNELRKYMLFYHKRQALEILQNFFMFKKHFQVIHNKLMYKIQQVTIQSCQQNIKDYKEVIKYIDQLDSLYARFLENSIDNGSLKKLQSQQSNDIYK